MEKNRKKITIAITVLVVIIIAGFLINRSFQKKLSKSSELTTENKFELSESGNFVLVQVGGIVERVEFESGKISQSEKLERGDLNGFSGLQSGYWNGNADDFEMLPSLSGKKFIVSKNVDTPSKKTSGAEYSCDVETASCEPTEVLSQSYAGMTDMDGKFVVWTAWDLEKNKLFGYYSNDEGTRGALYSCDAQEKKCIGTGEENIRIPEGSFDPSSMRFIVIAQNDDPAEQITGSSWEARIYVGSDLAEPVKKIDISSIIDRGKNVAYDGVNSVAWSKDGKKIALGTVSGIFLLDVDSEKVVKLYSDDVEDEEADYWNSDALAFSPDGRYVAFVEATTEAEGEEDENETEVGVLKTIDLQNNNEISELLEAQDLSLKL